MRRTFVWLSAALLAPATAASAQTFATAEITAGTFVVDASGAGIKGATYDLRGPGVQIVADFVEPGVVSGAVTCDIPGCRTGDVFTLHGNFSGSHLGIGRLVVDGQTLEPAYFSGTMGFSTGELTIPRGNRQHLVLSTPFVLQQGPDQPGVMLHASGLPDLNRPPDVILTLTGSGTATAFFERFRLKAGSGPPQFFYHLVRVVYSFE